MSEEDVTNDVSEAPDAKRGVSLWLAVSLSVNALLIGVIGGKMMGGEPRVDREKQALHDFQHNMRDEALSSLDEDRRRELLTEMQRVWRDGARIRAELEEARKATLAAGVANPYDARAMKSALADLRRMDSELQRLAHEAIADILADASPRERLESISRVSGIGPQGGVLLLGNGGYIPSSRRLREFGKTGDKWWPPVYVGPLPHGEPSPLGPRSQATPKSKTD